MGLSHNYVSSRTVRSFTISVLVAFLIMSSTRLMRCRAEGRAILQHPGSSKGSVRRIGIGSAPPRCERKCSSCGHCEAIQVPANPQEKEKRTVSRTSNPRNSAATTSSEFMEEVNYYSRGDDSSNYKPMSWKCKCGKFIFNP